MYVRLISCSGGGLVGTLPDRSSWHAKVRIPSWVHVYSSVCSSSLPDSFSCHVEVCPL